MVFSSAIFLFLFLPIVISLYFIFGKKYHNLVLFVAGLLFYAWGEKSFVFVLLASIVVNYIFGLFVDRYKQHQFSKLFLFLAITFNLSLLLVFKYLNLIVDSINTLLPLIHIKPILLGLSDRYPANRHIVKVASPCSVKQELILKSLEYEPTFTVTKICERASLHGVMFMDSMGLQLMPFLSENFKCIHFIWRYFDYEVMKEMLEKKHPDLVIGEVLERLFIYPFSDNFVENAPPS